jgi:hypothetical protein
MLILKRPENKHQSLSIYLSTNLPIYLSINQSTYLSIYLSINQSTYLSIYQPIYLSVYLSTNLPICLWLYSHLLHLGCSFSFLILYTERMTPWTGDQPVTRPLPTHVTKQTQNKRTQISMPWMGFEPTTPTF